MTEEEFAKLRALASERNFSDQIGFLLYWVHRRGSRALNEALAPLGIELRHMRILGVITLAGPQTQRQLIEMLDVDKSSMVYLIDTLEELGLAKREPAAGDRRAHAISITQGGAARLSESRKAIKSVNEKRYGVLSASEQDQLRNMLWRVLETEGDATSDSELNQFLRLKSKLTKGPQP